MAHKTTEGVCHICGRQGKMSFEHIPPRSVGNMHTSKAYRVVDIAEKAGKLDVSLVGGIRYKPLQRGSGFSTICRDCNNYLGRYYVNEFRDFFLATAQLISSDSALSSAKGIHLETGKANVLALFKHVISNFCTTSQTGTMLDCEEFLLNRESNMFPDRYRLFMYAVPKADSGMVTTGWSCIFTSPDFKSFYTVAHVAMFPIGFALVDTDASSYIPEGLGCDITTMANRPWGDRPQFAVDLPYMTLDQAIPAKSAME